MQEIKGVYYLVSWAMMFVGWIVVNQQNNRREERKEIRASLGEIAKILDELVSKSVAYHKRGSHSPEESKEIKLQMQRLGFKIQYLHFYSDAVNRSIYELRQSITYKNFDSWKHQAQPDDSDIIEGIYFATDDLLNNLEHQFGQLYRQGFRSAIVHELKRFKGMLQD